MTTFSTGGSAVTFTTSGSAVSFAVTAASNGFTTSAVLTPGAHASTHGAGGADPITTLGTVTTTLGTVTTLVANTATINAGTATNLVLVTPTIGTATATGGTFTNATLVTPTIGTATMTGGTATTLTAAGEIHTGQATFAAGSAAGPSLAFTGDTNTGIYSPGADQVGIATAGTAAIVVDASGRLGVGNVGTMSGGAAIQIIGGDNAPAGTMRVRRISASANPSTLSIEKARGTLPSSPASVNASDGIGIINFLAHDGTAYLTAATIAATVDGTPGTNDMPTLLTFSTTPDGTATLTERMRIDNAGLITGTGTSLGAWTSYTPTITATGWSLGDGTLAGHYTVIGKLCHARVKITGGSTTNFGSGRIDISNPLTAASYEITLGNAFAFDASVSANYIGMVRHVSSTAVSVWFDAASVATAAAFNSTSPFTWTVSDTITLTWAYEIS